MPASDDEPSDLDAQRAVTAWQEKCREIGERLVERYGEEGAWELVNQRLREGKGNRAQRRARR